MQDEFSYCAAKSLYSARNRVGIAYRDWSFISFAQDDEVRAASLIRFHCPGTSGTRRGRIIGDMPHMPLPVHGWNADSSIVIHRRVPS